jgi:xanthine dehydrogenase molybdopterin-binding subunit B
MPEMQEEMRDMTPPTFTRTGQTKLVGEWNAYEVRVEHPEQDGEMIMWFSQDVDADFRTLAQQVSESMSSLLNSPLLRMGGGGGGPAETFEQFQAQMNAVEMPDGFPVQIITDAGGSPSTNTLRAIDQNASFGPETWEPPAGYTKMDMPFIR